jgi:Asp-tRNA(Asn)/Glu-tRNA(Gln) amidotransferase A subunit family amidase
VPSAGNRRALLERGDADISFDLPPKDFDEMAKAGKLKVVGIPVQNAMSYTQPISFIGLPVLAAPIARPGALPRGIQIIGAPFTEVLLFRVAGPLEGMGCRWRHARRGAHGSGLMLTG